MRSWFVKLSLLGALGLLTPGVIGRPSAAAAQAPSAAAKEQARENAEAGELTGGAEVDAKGGVPLSFKTDLAWWSLITFVIFVMVLGRYAWKPLIASLDERESKVRGDISAAESARQKAEQLLAEHSKRMAQLQEEIRALLADARKDAEGVKQEIVAAAQKEAEAAKQRALGEISRARDSALKDLFDVMANEVAQATQHVLGRSINSSDQDRLIDEALTQFPRRK
jgi:F-type H+-transporting ATPase subunit b